MGKRWPLAVLVAALAAIYGPFVASGGLLAVIDGLGDYFPVRALVALALRQGELPFWNPLPFGGVPVLGMAQAGVFYPLNWLFLVLPPVAAMDADVLASSLCAGLALYAFVRALGVGRTAALAGALPYMLGGFLLAHLEHLTIVQAAGLIPALLWAVERFRQTLAPRWALGFCALFALQLFAGYPQISLLSLAIAWAYGWHRGRDLDARAWRGYATQLVLAGGLGIGLAAVQLLPVISFIRESARLALSYDEVVSHSLPPRQLPMLLFPFLFGGPRGPLFNVQYWGAGPYLVELQGYAGLAPWALALVALAAWREDRRVRFFLGLGLVGLVLSLGGYTPIYHLWAKLPILNSVRVPGRHVMELDLALCVLAALGLQRLFDAEPARRRQLALLGGGGLLGAIALVLAGVGLGRAPIAAHLQPWVPAGVNLSAALSLTRPAFWVPACLGLATALALALLARRPRAGAAVLLLVLLLDLGLFSRSFNWRRYGQHPGELQARLPDSPYRTISVTSGNVMYRWDRAMAVHAPQLTLFTGERSVSGYQSFLPRRYATLLGNMDAMGQFRDAGPFQPPNHALDLLGVQRAYVQPEARPKPSWQRLPDEHGVEVYLNPHALPRGWRVSATERLAPAAVDERIMHDPTFDPARTALLEDGPAPAGTTQGTVNVTTRSVNRLQVETDGPGPGLVLVSESYEPGWTARLADGTPLVVQRADGLIMAIAVPPGRQTVTLSYRPPGWTGMLALSLGSLALFLLWALVAWRHRDPSC